LENLVKKSLLALILVIASFAATGCSERINPGYVGIKVIASGTNRGVQDYPVQTGRVWYNPFTEDVLEYPTFVQTASWSHGEINEEITFSTADQMSLSADVSVAYQLRSEKVPAFYVTFRNDNLGTFTDGYLRNLTREKFDAVGGKYKIEQIMGGGNEFLQEVRALLQTDLQAIGVELKQFGFIGAPRPPQSVRDAIDAKVKAVQTALQTQNEVLQVEAQARKNIAEATGFAEATIKRAEAEAKANRLLAESLTSTLVEYQRLQKWDGKLPQVVGSGTTSLFSVK
jgi:regulator of protease activity HflC (stomatin/prohibitin superfamily)